MFKIISSNGAVMEHQMKKEVAGFDARRIMQENIKINQSKLNVTDISLRRRIDVDDARKNLKQSQKDFDRTAPETVDAGTRNALWKRAKQLKDEFSQGMLSKTELHPVKSFEVNGKINVVVDEERMRNERVVERNTSWYRKNQDKILEYKNIMRTLCPKDNNVSSDEQLAQEKHFTDIEKFRINNGNSG